MNIGNPQALGAKPFTFNRQVLAAMLTQDFDNPSYSKDDLERAKYYASMIPFQ